ncbi:hypothetical protein HD553DRAFT_199790 [Filobasidium floriforme]|uniref:uncharacterized protein n=1 Tax=Filobasidium floriforme TaxID=5210 RepID=UPI001E8EB0B0|nr:uncharacterized protein HD553DRAFT_199790 [Filobasidium floriforme]KAH8087470.1 hypothetical protein HD553DRAFT_199790 [Filobasidium floriforme]
MPINEAITDRSLIPAEPKYLPPTPKGLPDIAPFHGKPHEKVDHFIGYLRIRFRLDQRGFQDERMKALYTMSLLKGKAFRLVSACWDIEKGKRRGSVVGREEDLEDFETLAWFLVHHFGSGETIALYKGGDDARRCARTRLNEIEQTPTTSTRDYLLEVDYYRHYAGYTDEELFVIVNWGLEKHFQEQVHIQLVGQPHLRRDYPAFREEILRIDSWYEGVVKQKEGGWQGVEDDERATSSRSSIDQRSERGHGRGRGQPRGRGRRGRGRGAYMG